MPGTANGDPKSDLQAEGSLAGFETIEALLEVHTLFAADFGAHTREVYSAAATTCCG